MLRLDSSCPSWTDSEAAKSARELTPPLRYQNHTYSQLILQFRRLSVMQHIIPNPIVRRKLSVSRLFQLPLNNRYYPLFSLNCNTHSINFPQSRIPDWSILTFGLFRSSVTAYFIKLFSSEYIYIIYYTVILRKNLLFRKTQAIFFFYFSIKAIASEVLLRNEIIRVGAR